MNVSKADLKNGLPLVAILRGVEPDNCVVIAKTLIDEGFTMIEVPLNSPHPLDSISQLVKYFGSEYLIGAGTVTTFEKVKSVVETGANLVVTPNFDRKVVEYAVAANCVTFPGIVTPTEAFAALESGATGLKIFPIQNMGVSGFKALKSVLPNDAICLPVGGIEPTVESMKPYLDAGADGFGLGAALYKPGVTVQQLKDNARLYKHAYEVAKNK